MPGRQLSQPTSLGRTGLRVGRLGLAAGYGVPARAVRRAFAEHGVNYFYWEGLRKRHMREGLRDLARTNRDDLVIAIQSYDRLGFWMRRSVPKALSRLGIERADILFLGAHGKLPRPRVVDAARALKERGLVRFLGISGHNRRFHGELARRADSPFDVQMVRYSAAHRGAESDVFGMLDEDREGRPGIVTYTATRWGRLLRERRMPPGERPLTAAECYRFVLSHDAVDVCLAGPRSEQEMDEGLRALADGPLDAAEMERVRRIGDHVHG